MTYSKKYVHTLITLCTFAVLVASGHFVQARPINSEIVINEIDYDQPGTDIWEFIEIYNGSGEAINLGNYSLRLVNGIGSGASVYNTITLTNTLLASGDYFVVCGNAANVQNCDQDATPDSNLIQNGAPDAVALFFGDTLVDTVSYEGDTGAPYTEAAGTVEDDPSASDKSISRCPNGVDTDFNLHDFAHRVFTPGYANNCVDPIPIGACGDGEETRIHAVQGAGLSSPLSGEIVVVEGVVVGDFQDETSGLSGFFLQEEDDQIDGESLTSEGIFIYGTGLKDVNPGEVVRVLGEATEFYGLTELQATDSGILPCPGLSGTATPTIVNLPLASADAWERWEGMIITITQRLYVTGNYNLGRYGEVDLSVNAPLQQPTNIVSPGAEALAMQALNDRSRIQLDDGSNEYNPLPLPPYLAGDSTLRAGDITPGLMGVLSYAYGSYEIHPTQAVIFTRINERQTTPNALVGTITAAGINTLNFFTTLDSGSLVCGPSGNMECRGADTPAEFTRQRDKLLAALSAIQADVFALVELENNPSASLQDLVNGLNDVFGPGTYDYIDTGTIGADAIKVGLIYKSAMLTPAGSHAILDSSVDPLFIDTRNRPSLAQTFSDTHGEKFTVVVNHLKSKGSPCDGDPDINDGQGNCNLTRTQAATALINWLESDPTGSGDPDFLILGDLNAYAMEDPVSALKLSGYANLIEDFLGINAYSYIFEGQRGYLDHALASFSLLPQVSGISIWYINADEPSALDYNDYNQPGLYHADPYRASDHDAVIVRLIPGIHQRLFLPGILNTNE